MNTLKKESYKTYNVTFTLTYCDILAKNSDDAINRAREDMLYEMQMNPEIFSGYFRANTERVKNIPIARKVKRKEMK